MDHIPTKCFTQLVSYSSGWGYMQPYLGMVNTYIAILPLPYVTDFSEFYEIIDIVSYNGCVPEDL